MSNILFVKATSVFPDKPSLVRIQAALSVKGRVFKVLDTYVKNQGFEFGETEAKFTGIDIDVFRKEARQAGKAMTSFGQMWRVCDFVVGHNVVFSMKSIDAASKSLYGKAFMKGKPAMCLMQKGSRLITKSNKRPSLDSLYVHYYKNRDHLSLTHNPEIMELIAVYNGFVSDGIVAKDKGMVLNRSLIHI